MQPEIKQNSLNARLYLVTGLIGVLLILLYLGGVVACWYGSGPGPTSYSESPPNHPIFFYFFTIVLHISILGTVLYLINLGAVRYDWDEEIISRRSLWRKMALHWNEVAGLEFESHFWCGHVLFLRKPDGTRLRINYSFIGQDKGLLNFIQRKLGDISINAMDDTIAVGKIIFDSFGLRNDSGAIISLPYEAIRFVYRDAKYELGIKEYESPIFADEYGDRASIFSKDDNYHKAIFYLKTRLAPATWIDLTAKYPPSEPQAAFRYHVRKLDIVRSHLRQLRLWLPVSTVILIGWVYLDYLRGKKWDDEIDAIIPLLLVELTFIYQFFHQIWQWRISSRALPSLDVNH